MRKTERGEWMVFHPHEVLATFLLPLPDPLPFRDGDVLPSVRGFDNRRIDALKPVTSDLHFQRSSDRTVVTFARALKASRWKSQPTNWSNKFALHASVQLHQIFSETGLRQGLEPAMQLAKIVSGPPLLLSQKVAALSESPAGGMMNEADLREMGLGAVTVAECVVGLRITGTLPTLASPLGATPEIRDRPIGPMEADRAFPDEPSLWPWRTYSPGVSASDELVERRLQYALNVALEEVRSIQRAVNLIRRTPTAISTLERLPFAIPVVLRPAAHPGNSQSVLLLTRPDIGPVHDFAPEPLSHEEMSNFGKARQRAARGPFAAHTDVYREAQMALDRLGDYRLACLLFGIAAETLLDELLLHLMWEEGWTPERAAEEWSDSLGRRIGTELSKRLGGSWDRKGPGSIGVWSRDVASLRNRVAHAAYLPSKGEGEGSRDGVNQLVKFLCDRLADDTVRGKFPRTALALAGVKGLERRNAYTESIRALGASNSEPNWTETFARWHEAWRRTRQDVTSGARTADEAGADLLAVRSPDGSISWVLHDKEIHLAKAVHVAPDDVGPGLLKKFQTLSKRHDQSERISFLVMERVPTTSRVGAEWVEEYHHVPMTGVMVDGSDYSC